MAEIASSSPAPIIVLVGGGWHKPETYSKFTTGLEKAGLTVRVPTLPSITDARPPTTDLQSDTETVYNYVKELCDQGNKVIAIMHSYGGQVGSNALGSLSYESRAKEGLKGGVIHLVYMAAFALPEGKSMINKVEEFGHMDLMPLAFDFADDMSVLCRNPKLTLVGPGVPEEEVDAYLATTIRWNGNCMYQPIKKSAWREIPTSYVYCTADMTVPFDYQKSMVEFMREAGRPVETYEIETGHCPNLTATDKVVDAIGKITASAAA